MKTIRVKVTKSLVCIFWLLPAVLVFPNLFIDAYGKTDATPVSADKIRLAEEHMLKGGKAFDHGNFSEAVKQWKTAAGLYEQEDRTGAYIDTLCRLADGYRSLGQYPKAMQNLKLAQSLNIDDSRRMTKILGSLGQLYHLAADDEMAMYYLEKGLNMAGKNRDTAEQAAIYNNMGAVYAAGKAHEQALNAYAESRNLSIKANQPEMAATALINSARIYYERKDVPRAETSLKTALKEVRQLQDTHDKAFALLAVGRLFNSIGRLQKSKGQPHDDMMRLAYEAFKEAQNLAAILDDTAAKTYALGYLARLYEDEQRFDEALHLTRQAVFEAQKAHSHESLYLWQWQTGRLLRDQGNINEAIAAYRRAVYNLNTIREDLSLVCNQGNRLSFRDTVGPVYFELADLLLRRSAAQKEAKTIQSDLLEARNTVEQLKAVELQDYFKDDCVTTLQSKITSLDRIVKNTAAIYPILLPDRTELLVTLPDGLKQFTVRVNAETITSEVRKFRNKIQRPRSRYQINAQKLYNWLIRPLEGYLENHRIKTLIFVPDGPLRTIPMAALHDGQQFLVRKYAVVTTPGLTLTDPHPIQRENLKFLVSGLTEAVQGFPPLPNVSFEMQALQKLYQSTLLENKKFNIDNIENALKITPYPIVHIASHGQFNRDADKTFLLTYDAKLTMGDLESLMGLGQYRKNPVELLTLSACQTAAGDDRAALGLAGVALKAGARSALATLWFIDDEATSHLVTEFYHQFRDPSVSKARALQLAQIKLLDDERFQHPAYWAPFLLIGNWF